MVRSSSTFLDRGGSRQTAMGLGLAALGRPGYINLGHGKDLGNLQSGETTDSAYEVASMQAHAATVLNAAWELGFRYYDAARSYGRAEQFLGHWLRSRKIAPDDVTIASKWGYTYTAEWQIEAEAHEIKEHSLPVLQRQWQETAQELGAYLNLYQIHSATFESGVLENIDVLAELVRLKADNMAIGLTLSGPSQAEVLTRAIDVEIDGVALFDAVQATWNLLEPSAGDALAQASAAGFFVIVKEALANGRLTERNQAPEFSARLAMLQQEAARLNTTVDAVALAAVLAQPWPNVVLSGAATVEQVTSNASARSVAWDDTATYNLTAIGETAEQYWQTRSDLSWN